MLKKISCNIFLQKEIVFHEGLNAIVGDDIASNSIGKSTMLMIIDFVFGGDDYISKNHDVVDNLGHHDFRFIFNFDNKDYYFIRSTNEYKFVSICNEKFEILQSVTTEEFTAWLQEKYDCQLESLTFRNIVGRYFRIYGKENLNERKPIQYFEKETAPKSILALLKLFDKYKSDITVSQDLIIGYVKDGIMYEGEVFDELSGKYSFSPDEKGEYFFYLLSGSSDYLSLKSGNLEVN